MATFKKNEHLLSPKEFQAVYDRRRSASDTRLIIYARENTLGYSRIGLSVSKKFGGAVERNRLRRLYREAFRLQKETLPVGLDLVLIPRNSVEPELADLQKSLDKLVGQLAKKFIRDREEKGDSSDTPAAPTTDS